MVRLLLIAGTWVATLGSQLTQGLVLDRVGEYVAAYERRLGALAAEERYHQRVVGSRGTESRVIHSDFLFVRPPDPQQAWLGFRDAYSVDGRPVADRTDRLRKLLEDWSGDARAQAVAIAQESARHNIGGFLRTVNVPIGVLGWLHPRHRSAFAFSRDGSETIGVTRTWRLRFRELARPTRIRTPQNGDVVASGFVWVDPADGRVLQTELRADAGQLDTTIRVRFDLDARLALMVPVEMRESYRQRDGRRTITGLATYSNFRVFQVTTRVR
jgi:hypothetical protein